MKRFLVGAAVVLVGCYKATPPPASPLTTNATPTAPTPHHRDYRAALGDPVGFLPMNSELVLSIDADAARHSQLWDVAEEQIRKAGGSSLTTFITTCGFDPMTTVRGIAVGLHGLKANKPDGVVVISGLSRTKMTECLERAATPANNILTIDHGVFTIHPEPNDPTSVVFTFVDDATAVILLAPAANRAALDKVLSSGAPLRRSPTFTQLLAAVDTAAPIWGIANGNSSIFDLAQNSQKPTAIWGSLHLDSGASLLLRIRFADVTVAQQLATQAQSQLSSASAFFDRLDVVADGAELEINAAMSETKLSGMISLLGLVSRTPPPPPAAPSLGGP